ncbi:hypothetical protein Tsubulata_011826 [Turnera subulata]|uniref:CUE domain-containing protein n=1 Tax=Turnera subulata TaxID=218843 RepID=A0A9Q0FD25_9ROSI|nr:hypothetical protein Tsubulata_011826 [Turnera subulata]
MSGRVGFGVQSMGFKTVYQNLTDIFPQVDSRLLKAVAIEHPKDADAAVDVVLSEILPLFEIHTAAPSAPPSSSKVTTVLSSPPPSAPVTASTAPSSSSGPVTASSIPSSSSGPVTASGAPTSSPSLEDSRPSGEPDGEVELEEPTDALIRRSVPRQDTVGSSSGVRSMAVEDSNGSDTVPHDAGATLPEKIDNQPTGLASDADAFQLIANIENEELILFRNPQCQQEHVQSGSIQSNKDMSKTVIHEGNAELSRVCPNTDSVGSTSMHKSQDFNPKVEDEQTSNAIQSSSVIGNIADEDLLDVFHAAEQDFGSPVAGDFDMVVGGKNHQEVSSVEGTAAEVENSVVQQIPDVAECPLELPSSPTIASENILSNHQSKIEFLEEIVEAAKDNKKTLFSAMDSVMNMMRQVELAEKAAEQAQEEASRGGLDILVKVEELKEVLAHAKEANEMHTGEVYGEKAILATEVKELQARLISLSDERDSALGILDEIRQALEVRLAAAEELRKEAEQEKLQKEETANGAFAELQILMEKVVQESNILRQEAEENSKLRDFLMDRGRVVDALQGEISVICQDVRLLKEKFDNRVPLSQSISSSQTSCILASSGSSLKSVKSDLVGEEFAMSTSPKQKSLEASAASSPADAQSPRSATGEKTIVNDNLKELMDDGWDFFYDEDMQKLGNQ